MDEQRRHKLQNATSTLKELLAMVAYEVPFHERERMQYAEYRQLLLKTEELAPLLPSILRECHTLHDFWGFIFSKYPLPVPSDMAKRIDFIRKEFLSVLDALDNDRVPAVQKEGQQFFPAGTQHSGFLAIRDIVTSAKKSLLIADNFVDKTLWPQLTNVITGASVRVLTKQTSPDFGIEAKTFTKQYGIPVEVRTTDALHDRFVVCDNLQCWHLGASIKDLGLRAALISEVVSPTLSSAVRNELDKVWIGAKPL
jgi:hypothetical protein